MTEPTTSDLQFLACGDCPAEITTERAWLKCRGFGRQRPAAVQPRRTSSPGAVFAATGQTEGVGALLYEGDRVRESRSRTGRWECGRCSHRHEFGGIGRHFVVGGGWSSRTEYDYGIKTQDRGAQESSPNLGFDKYAVS
jgi:hypothetical protein